MYVCTLDSGVDPPTFHHTSTWRHTHGCRGNEVKFTLRWNVIPYAGIVPHYSSGAHNMTLPKIYSYVSPEQ